MIRNYKKIWITILCFLIFIGLTDLETYCIDFHKPAHWYLRVLILLVGGLFSYVMKLPLNDLFDYVINLSDKLYYKWFLKKEVDQSQEWY